MEGRVICAFSYRVLERQRGRERRRGGGGERKRGSELIKMATGREEEGEGRMRDGWLTQS